jgi:hypothetical protein
MSCIVFVAALPLALVLALSGCAGDAAGGDDGLPALALRDADPQPLDTAAIDSITGLKGTLTKDNSGADVFKLTQGRTDVPITVEGRKMEPFMGFTSWAAFQMGAAKPAMMTGDLVVFQDEVSPVMDAFLAHGCAVTALHNHFFFEEPKTYFMHFGGEGPQPTWPRASRPRWMR